MQRAGASARIKNREEVFLWKWKMKIEMGRLGWRAAAP